MKRVGFIGWRGMVGSVLMQRMQAEGDFGNFEAVFFSSSQMGAPGPALGGAAQPLKDARSIDDLKSMDILVSCQGGDYTTEIHPRLRAAGWNGYWVDAASTLRMKDDALIVLDPLNMSAIRRALKQGRRDFIGGNCTVSLMLMAMHGLLKRNLVHWITAMTYQAASGAGAQHMRELLQQMGRVHEAAQPLLSDPASAILDIDRAVSAALVSDSFPSRNFGHPVAGSLLPWIDKDLGAGQSREEWKAGAEANKILGRASKPVPIEGICVRIGAMRCHSQALTIKLKKDLPLDEVSDMLAQANEWVRVVPNEREASLAELSPARVSGTLSVPVGRLRKVKLDRSAHLLAFTVGDQLLWGAAEPLRRMLRVLVTSKKRSKIGLLP